MGKLPAEPGQLITGHPAAMLRREAARSLSLPSSTPGFTKRPSRGDGETQTGGNARDTVMVCTARTPNFPSAAAPAEHRTLSGTSPAHDGETSPEPWGSWSLSISSTKMMLLVAALKALEGLFIKRKQQKKAVKHSWFICST